MRSSGMEVSRCGSGRLGRRLPDRGADRRHDIGAGPLGHSKQNARAPVSSLRRPVLSLSLMRLVHQRSAYSDLIGVCRQVRTLEWSTTQMVPKTPRRQVVDVQDILTSICTKWGLLILYELAKGRRRHGELRRTIGGVSQKM